MGQQLQYALDWDTAKIQYEVLGDSLAKVAISLQIPLQSVEHVAQDEGWERMKPSSNQYKLYLAGMLQEQQAKLSIAMLYRELEMFPHVAELETLLVQKISQTTKNLDPYDQKTPSNLRSLSAALNSITERQILLKQQLADLFSTDSAPQVAINMNVGAENGVA